MVLRRGDWDIMPKNDYWQKGERYDILMGDGLYYDQTGHHSRIPVWIRDNATGVIVKRVGDGRQMGNWHPVTINWKGKKVEVQEMLKKRV
jgi:hypothetical protein